jgi:hypothetical protein
VRIGLPSSERRRLPSEAENLAEDLDAGEPWTARRLPQRQRTYKTTRSPRSRRTGNDLQSTRLGASPRDRRVPCLARGNENAATALPRRVAAGAISDLAPAEDEQRESRATISRRRLRKCVMHPAVSLLHSQAKEPRRSRENLFPFGRVATVRWPPRRTAQSLTKQSRSRRRRGCSYRRNPRARSARAGATPFMRRRSSELTIAAGGFLCMLALEPDVDAARVPEPTGAPIRGHRRRDRDRFDGVGDQPSPCPRSRPHI